MTQSSTAAFAPSALTQRTSDAVPREVLTWLQALSLSSTVKNVKRDLSNGCVLAQICAHYWDQVPLHSFNNGVSAASKLSNWYVLQKVMRKHGVEVSPTMVRGMVDGVDDCAVAFLKQLYTVFTGRVIEDTPVPLAEPLVGVPDKDIPAFAAANANSAAARARHAADGGTSFSGVLGASSSMAVSRYGASGRADRALSFGMGSTSATSSAAAAGSGAGGATRVVPASLPPLMPPPPVEAPFAAAAVASGKPALNVAVRPAGQVSTVLPSAAAAAATESASCLAGERERGVTSTGLPMGTALATTWFCAKVREALPTEVAEMLSSANRAAADVAASSSSSSSSLTATLAWLSAPDGAYDADVVYSGEGDESIRESQAEVRQRVWRLLLASAHDLATLVLHCSPHGLDVLVDHLFSAVRDTTLCTALGEEKPAGVAFARNAAQFCAALLMHLSDADVHAALRCFQTCLLTSDAFAAALRGVRWCVAKEYAAVVVAALPPNRAVAATVLESLWTSLEDVVRDVDGEEDEKDMLPEVSLVVLVHALLQTLLPLHTGATAAAAAAQKRTSPLTANSMASAGLTGHFAPDGTRPPSSAMARRKSQRTRSTQVAAAAAAAALTSATRNGTAMEEKIFDAVVVRLAHQRCTDALLHVSQAPSLFSAMHASDSTVLLVEAAAALAVDLLRVEVPTPLVRRMASGDDLLDVFHVLFELFNADGESGAGSVKDVPEDDAAAAAAAKTTPPLSKKRSVLMHYPALAVLRARWLRWCLQRRWQYCLSGRTSTPELAGVQLPSLGGSMGGLSDTEALQAMDKEAWGGGGEMEEERAIRRGLQVVCAELFTSLGGEEADAAVSGEAPEDVATRLAAKVLVACAMAEVLPFLPAQYKSSTNAAASGAAPGSSEAGGGPVNLYNTHGDENDGDGIDNPTRTLQQQQYQQSEVVYAEAVAEAVLHVLMREASAAQVRALLRSPSSATPTAPPPAVRALEASVTLMHAVVGPLTFPGALVLRGDVLLLVKAMLCVLDTVHASSLKGPAVEKEVAVVARRLGARAAVMAREGQVEESLRSRIGWMHALLVEGRRMPPLPSGPSIPTQTAAAAATDIPPPLLTGDDAATAQWHAIILDCWDTFMVVLQAATLRLRQRGGTAVAAAAAAASGSSGIGQVDPALLLEAVGESLLICAQQSQEVVRCLERELSSVLPGRGAAATAAASMANEINAPAAGKSEGVTLNSALLSGPVASFVQGTSPEEVQAAVGWMWTVVGGS